MHPLRLLVPQLAAESVARVEEDQMIVEEVRLEAVARVEEDVRNDRVRNLTKRLSVFAELLV